MEESESATPPTKKRRASSRPIDRQQIARVPRGYTNDSNFPVLILEDDDERCPHCFCRPCVISQPPDFLRGSAAAHIRNRSKRFNLYVKFWGMVSSRVPSEKGSSHWKGCSTRDDAWVRKNGNKRLHVTKIKKNYFKFRRCVEDIQTQREYRTPIIFQHSWHRWYLLRS